MAAKSQTWPIFIAVAVLAMHLCTGEKSCSIWSTAGPVVQRGSSFKVYCTFNCKCKGSMCSDHPPTLQSHKKYNATTIYLNVVNITKNRTYSCQCTCPLALDPCGLDISAGYAPDRPKNLSCIYKVLNSESGVVFCTWSRGRDTYLWNSSELWVTTVSGNHTAGPVEHKVSSKGTDLSSASFSVSSSVQLMSVWVRVQNPLGSAVSATINYTLSDIAMPSAPVLGQPKCSSRKCIITVEQPVRSHHLEIQYRAEAQTWKSYLDSGQQMRSPQVWSISSLEPYRLYHFRARSKFSTGLWSQWSTSISRWTQEEAPAKELDVWYAESGSDLNSLRVYWKELNSSVARGKIMMYKVSVYSQTSGLIFDTNASADARSCSVPFCGNCEVTVKARNSKGLSPPARITPRQTKDNPPEDVHVTANNRSVTISWKQPESAAQHAAYLVEWYPEGHKPEELRWVRLGRNDSHAVITDVKPFECYGGAVYALYEGSVSVTRFTGVATLKSVPAVGPSVQEKVEGDRVMVTWMEIPRGQRGGCIAKYTLYLDGGGSPQTYPIEASKGMHVLSNLRPALYSLRMTASTAEGEGPAGPPVKFVIQQETQLPLLLVCTAVLLLALLLLCLCQSSAVKQRFWVFFQCLMLDVVPDPANSKWAKECIREKGSMKLQLQPCSPNQRANGGEGEEEEEEPILVDVEEIPKWSSDACTPTDASSQLLPPQSGPGRTDPAAPAYPVTTYIKTLSQDSDSSEHTQASLDTTVDYISSHGLENLDRDEEDPGEDADFVGMLGFLPSHDIVMEPLRFGGKLTLDSVKIGCNDFFLSN